MIGRLLDIILSPILGNLEELGGPDHHAGRSMSVFNFFNNSCIIISKKRGSVT